MFCCQPVECRYKTWQQKKSRIHLCLGRFDRPETQKGPTHGFGRGRPSYLQRQASPVLLRSVVTPTGSRTASASAVAPRLPASPRRESLRPAPHPAGDGSATGSTSSTGGTCWSWPTAWPWATCLPTAGTGAETRKKPTHGRFLVRLAIQVRLPRQPVEQLAAVLRVAQPAPVLKVLGHAF